MKALAALDEELGDFDTLVLDTVDHIVTTRIAEAIGISVGDSAVPAYTRVGVDPRMPVSMSSLTVAPATMGMAVADGLSSEEVDEDEDEEELPEIRPIKTGATVQQVLKDNEVEDPDTEAVSEDNEEVAFDELFSSHITPALQEAASKYKQEYSQPEEPVKTSRPYAKKMPKLRAKVSEYTDKYSE